MSEKKFLEVEAKYNADDIDRMAFKDIAKSLSPKSFVYVESKDIYYVKGESEFLRYRMPAENTQDGTTSSRSELTFKKKHTEKNNIVRTEVNLRVDLNDPTLVEAFCQGLGYAKNFSIHKSCDIYYYEDADIVYYSVKDEAGKYANFLEIEVDESLDITQEQAREIIQKYEKFLSPLGISAQKRKKLSLFEMYKKTSNEKA